MKDGQFSFLDIISVMSFCIALQNLDLNVSSEDILNTSNGIVEQLEKDIDDIHGHLSVQDTKLNVILSKLEELENGSQRDISANIREKY